MCFWASGTKILHEDEVSLISENATKAFQLSLCWEKKIEVCGENMEKTLGKMGVHWGLNYYLVRNGFTY